MSKVWLLFVGLILLIFFNRTPPFVHARSTHSQVLDWNINSLRNYVRDVIGFRNGYMVDDVTLKTIKFKIDNIIGSCGGPCMSAGKFRKGMKEFTKYLKHHIPDESILRTITFNIINIVGDCACKYETDDLLTLSEVDVL